MICAPVRRRARRRARRASLAVALATIATVAAAGVTAGPAAAGGAVVVVGPAGLPAALAGASPGETIVLEPGVYAEAVSIAKDNVTLVGSGSGAGGTVLTWPAALPVGSTLVGLGGNGDRVTNLRVDLSASPAVTPANPFNTGIGTTSPAPTGTRVDHVAVVGNGAPGLVGTFVAGSDGTIRGSVLSGLTNAVTVAVNGATVEGNTLSADCSDVFVLDLSALGLGAATASHVTVQDNTITGPEACPGGPAAYGAGYGAITVFHAPYSTVRDNTVTGVNDIAIGADTQHLTVQGNTLRNECLGIAFSDLGLPDGAGTATVAGNEVQGTGTAACYPGGYGTLATGIRIDGATNTTVVGNEVHKTVAAPGSTVNGIVVDDLPKSANDQVVANEVHLTLGSAAGYDLFWDGSDSPIFRHNECKTSSPAGLCS